MFKKILTLIALLTLGSHTIYAAGEFSITAVTPANDGLLKVILDSDIVSESGELSGDIKVFKDMKIESMTKNEDDDTKLIIKLSEELMPNTSYSFLSVYGTEGNIDFSLNEELMGVEITNPDLEENAKSVFIVTPYDIEVTFKKSIIADDLDVKILKNVGVNGVSLDLENKSQLNIQMKDLLEEKSKYILMIFSLSIIGGDDLSITNSIYDFQTETFSFMPAEENNAQNNEEIIPEVSESGVTLDGQIGDVALNAAETPDTGAETWVLIALTFFMSSIIFLRRKFVK